MAVPACLRRSPRACSSKRTRRQLHLEPLELFGLRRPIRRRGAVPPSPGRGRRHRWKSSPGGPTCCGGRAALRTRPRSAGPRILRKTSFQVSHISLSSPATSHSDVGLFASTGSSAVVAQLESVEPSRLQGALDLPFDKWSQTRLEKIECPCRPVRDSSLPFGEVSFRGAQLRF